jgi:two-component system cell cycle sensor histidine kinase/response regulator CckA
MSDLIHSSVPSLIEELDATRTRLWKIFTEGFGGILLLDAQGKILYDGVGSRHLLGHTDGAEVGRSVLARLHPDDHDRARAFLLQVANAPGATSSKIVLRFLHTDGAYRWIEGTITNCLDDPDIRAHVCHWHDVTAWKESEAELRQLGRLHSAVIETAVEGVCIGHSIAEFPGLRFTFWNERMTAITGCTLEEINRRGWIQTLHAESSDQDLVRLHESTRGGATQPEEWTITRPDGVRRIVSLSTTRLEEPAGVNSILFLLEDVTQRWQAQRSLEREERRLRTALRAARMISWDWTAQKNEIHFSADVDAFFGAAEPRGPGPFPVAQATLLIAPHDRDRLQESFQLSRTATGEFSVQWQGVAPNVDGSPRWFASLGKQFSSPADGRIERMCGVTWEITQARRADDERRALERRVQETLRLESLGILAGGIAHEFNNLLTGILGYAGLIRGEAPDNSAALAHVLQIENAGCKAATLCSQMLAAAGRGRFVVKPVDLSQLIRASLVLLHSAMSRPVELTCVLSDQLPSIGADAPQIQQVIMNLVTNASEALEDRAGTIRLTTGTDELDAAKLACCVQSAEASPGSYVFVEVADDGAGMEPVLLARIFEPFFSTKFTGRGLGLAAVLGIVRGHKGTIQVSSIPNVGSRFRIFLPIRQQHQVHDPSSCSGPLPRSGHILIVDDDPRIRDLTVRLLAHEGLETLTATDGADAIERLDALAPHIGLVLLDLTMPKLDGIETARMLRRSLPNIPIILMSGFSEQESTARMAGLPLVRFLNKPFKRQELMQAIRASLADQQKAEQA